MNKSICPCIFHKLLNKRQTQNRCCILWRLIGVNEQKAILKIYSCLSTDKVLFWKTSVSTPIDGQGGLFENWVLFLSCHFLIKKKAKNKNKKKKQKKKKKHSYTGEKEYVFVSFSFQIICTCIYIFCHKAACQNKCVSLFCLFYFFFMYDKTCKNNTIIDVVSSSNYVMLVLMIGILTQVF